MAAGAARRRAGLAAALACSLLAVAPPAAPHDAARRPVPPVDAGLSAHPSLAVIREAPDFTLLDPAGQPVSLSALRGRAVLVSFIYTACPSACPLVSARMARLARRLAAARLLGRRAVLLSVTVDPERDGPEVLARHARGFGADPPGWRFLRADRARLGPVLAAYDEWTRPAPRGEIEHPARLHLIDPRGRVREIYDLALFDERQAYLDIQALLRE
jgi:protein SCO1/2